MTKIFTLGALLLGTLSAISQPQFSSSIYGNGNMNAHQIDFAYSAKSGWNGYILSGADNLHKIPGMPLTLQCDAPQARIFKLNDGKLLPVWEVQQAAETVVADSNKSIQQFGLEYSPALNCFVNIFDPQNNGQDHHRVQLFDTAFRLIADIPAAISMNTDVQFKVENGDTFMYSFDYREDGYSIYKHQMSYFSEFREVWQLAPQISDTAQTQLREGSCIAEHANANDRKDLFRPDALEVRAYSDSDMIAVSERNTSLVRIWLGKDGNFYEFARIGGDGNTFGTETWIGHAPELSAVQDFRIVRSWNDDSLCVSVLSAGGCNATTAKGLILMWYPKTHEIRLVQVSDLGIKSSDLGSFRVALGNGNTLHAIENAPKMTCFGNGNGRPETDSITGFPVGYFPIEDGGQIDFRYPDDATPVLAMNYTNIFNWDGKLRIAFPSKAIPFNQGEIRQPYINCTFAGDSIELSVNGMSSVHSWNNSNSNAATIVVPRNVDATYMMKGKYNEEMFGYVYSEPVTVADGACTGRSLTAITSLNTMQVSNFRVYPNPTIGEFTIDYAGSDVPVIYNALGQDMDVQLTPIAHGYKGHMEKRGTFYVKNRSGQSLKLLVL
ncbi:MAG: hypothetical protein U0T73_00260 [Chitinophagales bacterium]